MIVLERPSDNAAVFALFASAIPCDLGMLGMGSLALAGGWVIAMTTNTLSPPRQMCQTIFEPQA